MSRSVVVLSLAFALTGCANPYAKFYTPVPGGTGSALNDPQFEPPPSVPAVYQYSAHPDDDNRALIENGFVAIGSSSFNGAMNSVTRDQLLDEARKVGAAVVLVTSQYTHTVSGAMPYTVYHPGQVVTSQTTGTASAYGSGGYATGTYSGTTTTTLPGTTTTNYIPYNVQRADFGATYWAKRRSFVFGGYFGDTPPDVRARLQQNGGAVVNIVVKGTPAFNADVLPGDVVLTMDGQRISGPNEFLSMIGQKAGQEVSLEIWRDGAIKNLSMRLGH